MSKMAIEWHENRLKNMRKTLEIKREGIAMLEDSHERIQRECNFLDDQIESAKKKHKGGFDADRFMRKVPVKR